MKRLVTACAETLEARRLLSAAALLKDIAAGNVSSSPGEFASTKTYSLFAADDGTHGMELWRTDGTAAGTFMLKDINVGAGSSSPTNFFVAGTTVLFAATTPANGTELYWTRDGVTVLSADINPGAASSSPGGFAGPAGSKGTFFAATDPTRGRELWKLTTTGTSPTFVADINPGATSSDPSELSPSSSFGGVIVFAATSAASGRELWTSNGASSDTQLSLDLNPGAASSSPTGLISAGRFFIADDGTHGRELFQSDGTVANTHVIDVKPGAASSNVHDLISSTNTQQAFFSADDGTHGDEPWYVTSTTAPRMMADIVPGSGGSSPSSFTIMNQQLFFRAQTSGEGAELWYSNGTPQSTHLVLDIASGAADGLTTLPMAAAYGRVFFVANDGSHGNEVWVTDGTAAGTSMTSDLAPGPDSGALGAPRAYLGSVFFQGTTSATGAEPYVVTDSYPILLLGTKLSQTLDFLNIFISELGVGFAPSDVTLTNLSTGLVVAPNGTGMSQSNDNVTSLTTMQINWQAFNGGELSTGVWQVSIPAGAFTDTAGLPNPAIDYRFFIGNEAGATFRLARDPSGQNVQLFVNGNATPAADAPISSLEFLEVRARFKNLVPNSLTVDLTNGVPFLPGKTNWYDTRALDDQLTFKSAPASTRVDISEPEVRFGDGASTADGGTVLSLFGADVYTYDTTPTTGAGDDLTVRSGVDLDFSNASQTLARLTIDDGASAELVPAPSKLLTVGDLSIAPAGKLEVWANDVIVKNTPLAAVAGYIRTAYNLGDWRGAGGLFSGSARTATRHNTTLGILSGDDYLNNNGDLFNGKTIQSTDVVVKYTYFGDVDFSGTVDASDYNLIDFAFVNHLTGWANGDIDYSGGLTDASDYNLIDYAFSTQGAAL